MNKNDPSNYRKVSEPFQNIEEANKALEKFFEAVEQARNDLKISDVHIITKVNILRTDGEGAAMASAHFGNTLEGAPMCAWGLGQEQANFEHLLASYIKNK